MQNNISRDSWMHSSICRDSFTYVPLSIIDDFTGNWMGHGTNKMILQEMHECLHLYAVTRLCMCLRVMYVPPSIPTDFNWMAHRDGTYKMIIPEMQGCVHVCAVTHSVEICNNTQRCTHGCAVTHPVQICKHSQKCAHVCAVPHSLEICGEYTYGVAMIRRLLKIIGLFCKISSPLWGSFAKETYNFKKPTHRSHHIECSTSNQRGIHLWHFLLEILNFGSPANLYTQIPVYSTLQIQGCS